MPTCAIDGDLILFDPGRERVFRYVGRTTNPRVLAAHDAAVVNDGLLTIYADGVTIEFQHHVAGIEERMLAFDWLDEPVAYFDEVDQLRAGEVAEIVNR
jgi:hypothetical protein